MPTSKGKFFAVFFICLVVVAAAVIIAVTFTTKRDGLGVKFLDGPDVELHTPADYKNSRLNLYKNKTFVLSVIYTGGAGADFAELLGIGTWTRAGNTYTFKFMDMFRRIGMDYVRDVAHADWEVQYIRGKRGLEVQTPDHTNTYFFK